jgi:preprotein translocase subunit SecG
MSAVLIVVHLMIVLALIAVVLLQRSEGGALGIGGGGGGGNLMTGRSAANALTRATTYLAIGFFATSIALSITANFESSPNSILDQIEDSGELNGTGEGILDALPGALPEEPTEPTAPVAE